MTRYDDGGIERVTRLLYARWVHLRFGDGRELVVSRDAYCAMDDDDALAAEADLLTDDEAVAVRRRIKERMS